MVIGACGTHEPNKKCIKMLAGKSIKKKEETATVGNLDVDGRIILKCMLNKWDVKRRTVSGYSETECCQ
jgi:hypothetical protein